jgi:hypothetical protein
MTVGAFEASDVVPLCRMGIFGAIVDLCQMKVLEKSVTRAHNRGDVYQADIIVSRDRK